ncbi:MAG: nickel-responsive transcriptional regulator NikR [Hyphomicrobiaceae bacterium]
MQRVTVTIDDELMREIDAFVSSRGYQNRSEAVRDLSRAGLARLAEANVGDGVCVGALVYAYDHETRALSRRLAGITHDHHDLSTATMHVHLDHDSCLEVAVLRGPAPDLKRLAAEITSERGVRHGQLVLVPVEVSNETHSHGGARHPHTHIHVRDAG